MNAPTPMFFYVLYASPFVVAAIILAWTKFAAWRASKANEMIEKPITRPEDPIEDHVRSEPMRRHYMSYANSAQ